MRFRFDRVHATRRLVVWLVAFVVPLQGLAVCLLQTRGPAHTHVHATATERSTNQGLDDTMLAADFRRSPGGAVGHAATVDPVTRFLADVVHGHSHEAANFHYHAIGDASVRYVDGDGFGGALGDDGGTGDGSGPFLPLPAEVPRWSISGRPAAPIAATPWTPTLAFRAPLDRPPSVMFA